MLAGLWLCESPPVQATLECPLLQVSANSNQTVRFGNTTRFAVVLASTIETDAGATFADNFLIDNRATW